jgi:hypothetical protein
MIFFEPDTSRLRRGLLALIAIVTFALLCIASVWMPP